MSIRIAPTLGVAICVLLFAACSKEPSKPAPKVISDSELQLVMSQRFVDLHQTYLALDGAKYTDLLRATLRHARRLSPSQCVTVQARLIEVANQIGYDGLEPVWLVYQDCSAAGDEKSLGSARTANAQRTKEGLRFARKEPLPQVALRVTHWNSTLERGVRPDAVRAVLQQFTAAQPAIAQAWSLHQLIAQPTTSQALCALPVRVNQFGKTATVDLFRRAGCLSGGSLVPGDVCSKLFPAESAASGAPPSPLSDATSSLSEEEVNRLKEICSGMSGAGALPGAGIDDLDGYSQDQCNSEDTTRLYETEKIAGLLMQCYDTGVGNPLASGATSANYDRCCLNSVVTWERDGSHHVASLMTGESNDDPGRKFYSAEGSTPREARENLLEQLKDNPPPGTTVTEKPDGSVTVNRQYTQENPDGTTSQVDQSDTYGADGSGGTNKTVINEDGSGSGDVGAAPAADGSSSSIKLEWDADGNVTKSTSTSTDKDGKTTTTTTDYEYDDDGEVVNTKTSTSASAGMPGSEGGFDPKNPACRELMALEVMPGGNRTKVFNDLLGRPFKQDPRTVNPTPDQADQWNEEPFCGAPGLGSNDPPAKCRSLMMCTEDSYMDSSCECKRHAAGSVTLRGCATALCPDNTTPTPVGPGACSCVSGEDTTAGVDPSPGPRPDVERALSELIWNRPGGEYYVTETMVRERNRAGAEGTREPVN